MLVNAHKHTIKTNKSFKKWRKKKTDQRHTGHYHLNHLPHCGDPSGRRERGGRIFVKTMIRFPNFMKYVTINLQKAQWTPGKMNSETHSKTLLKSLANKNKWPITFKGPSVRLSAIIFMTISWVWMYRALIFKRPKEKKNEGDDGLAWWKNAHPVHTRAQVQSLGPVSLLKTLPLAKQLFKDTEDIKSPR